MCLLNRLKVGSQACWGETLGNNLGQVDYTWFLRCRLKLTKKTSFRHLWIVSQNVLSKTWECSSTEIYPQLITWIQCAGHTSTSWVRFFRYSVIFHLMLQWPCSILSSWCTWTILQITPPPVCPEQPHSVSGSLSKFSHISAYTWYWLPTEDRTKFKILLPSQALLVGSAPALNMRTVCNGFNSISSSVASSFSRSWRSSGPLLPLVNTTALSCDGRFLWNKLPVDNWAASLCSA